MSGELYTVKPLCVIPVYNNAGTLVRLAAQCREQMTDVLVVDDGSTDADLVAQLAGTGVTVIRHAQNRGKGAALLTALSFAREHDFTHLIALDADGQHAPADLPLFLEAIRRSPQALVIGIRDFSVPNVPPSSQFGRSFSNFWIALETGVVCADTQCGYRAYPVNLIAQLRFSARHFDFEIEVLARAFWAGLPLVEVPVATWYAPQGERITHFHKGWDNLRITHTHVKLLARRLCLWPNHRLVPKTHSFNWRQLVSPAAFIKRLMHENATPLGLGTSAAVGTFLAVLPIPWFHTLVILYVTTRLNLNRIMALAIQNFFAPPFTNSLCMMIGHLMLHGTWMPRLPRSMADLYACLAEWVVGSLVIAPLFALISGVVVYKVAALVQSRNVPRTERTRGNALGFWFFRVALRLTGLRGAYGLLYFVCAYYAAFDRKAVAGADAYVRHRFPDRSVWRRRIAVYRLFISQGKCLIDRHAYNAGLHVFDFDSRSMQELYRKLSTAKNGFILLLAHVGGWQLALPHLRQLSGDRPVSLLMRAAETADVREHVRGDDAGFHVIEPDAGPGCVVEMMTRLQRGEIVSIMGDRAYGGQTVEVPFLGAAAHFPVSAFAVARAAQCPVIALFVAKTGLTAYCLEPVLFEVPSHADRQSIRAGVRSFAEALADFTQRFPDQCFLFSDIWS